MTVTTDAGYSNEHLASDLAAGGFEHAKAQGVCKLCKSPIGQYQDEPGSDSSWWFDQQGWNLCHAAADDANCAHHPEGATEPNGDLTFEGASA